MATVPMSRSHPLDFYRAEIRSALFERLDQAFPEFAWKWTGRGWMSMRTGDDSTSPRVRCDTPDEFYFEGGKATSWLAYVNGGTPPDSGELEEAIQKLASLAQVEYPYASEAANAKRLVEKRPVEKRLVEERPVEERPVEERPVEERPVEERPVEERPVEERPVEKRVAPERIDALMDCFLRYGFQSLQAPLGAACRDFLQKQWGLEATQLKHYPVGCYSNQTDVRRYLVEQGFAPHEIDASLVAADSRCEGRLLLPARDVEGRLMTVIAQRLQATDDEEPETLHLKGRRFPLAFGLDVALRKDRDEQGHVIFVTDRLEAIALQVAGAHNVAAMGATRERFSRRRWERLAQLGVKSVTLAFNEREARGRLRGVIDQWARARFAPRLKIADPSALGRNANWWSLLVASGNAHFRDLMGQSCDAMRYKALQVVKEHRPGPAWTDRQREAALAEAYQFAGGLPRTRHKELKEQFWPVFDDLIPYQKRSPIRFNTTDQRIPNWEIPETQAVAIPARDCVPQPKPEPVVKEAIAVQTVAEQFLQLQTELREGGRGFRPGLFQRKLPMLDAKLSGMRGLVLLAGHAGVGKTCLALQCATDVLLHDVDTCAVFVSLSMPRRDLLARLTSRSLGIDWQNLMDNQEELCAVAGKEPHRLHRARSRPCESFGQRMTLVDAGDCAVCDEELILVYARKLSEKTGCGKVLIVVDDLNGWPPDDQRPDDRGDSTIDRIRRISNDARVDAVLVTATVRKNAVGGSDEFDNWQTIHTSRLVASPDTVCVLRQSDDDALLGQLADCRFPTVSLARWKDDLALAGVAPCSLEIVKCRDGGERGTIDLAFDYRQANFREESVTPSDAVRI